MSKKITNGLITCLAVTYCCDIKLAVTYCTGKREIITEKLLGASETKIFGDNSIQFTCKKLKLKAKD